jgi:twitching motility protein PilT
VQSIQRIFSVFPSEQQNNVMYQLSNSLQAIIAQNLLARADGQGQVLATEICIATQAVRSHIREGHPHMLFSEIQIGRKHQMVTMDAALMELYQAGDITYDAAITAARDSTKFRKSA